MLFRSDKVHEVPEIVRSEKTDYAGVIADTGKGLAVILDINGVFTREERKAFEKTLESTQEATNAEK